MIVDLAVYDKGVRRPGKLELHQVFECSHEPGAFVWLGLHEPSPEEFEGVRAEFDLHPLAVEDALRGHQRPKVELYDDTLFVVMRTARYDDPTETVEFAEILLFLGDRFVITVRHGSASALTEVRHAVEAQADLLAHGPMAVLHAVLDRVVDDYGPVCDGIDNDIIEVDGEVFSHTRGNPTQRIYELKREVLEFYRNMWPLEEAVESLERLKLDMVHPELHEYFRDVRDHLKRHMSRIDLFREQLTDVLNANLSQMSVRQNDDMRRISAWVAVAAIPTMVGGVYGMNFEHMPELAWTWGYPAALALIVAGCSVAYRHFRRSGWL